MPDNKSPSLGQYNATAGAATHGMWVLPTRQWIGRKAQALCQILQGVMEHANRASIDPLQAWLVALHVLLFNLACRSVWATCSHPGLHVCPGKQGRRAGR